ncbi:sulfite exporter TauE/SafE family protein [Futiania mangrovi]|uniref:Probable membrane transporter protein n=1 Tax=Futiania mangrovi TaxID=2959716 RepID=A0A9J6PED6_9PROT|nr:sulfite exporter TauE/SafE family protein [Futiania mangrovii]MCP1336192.1 sulfite exporter TauE/SafE family protein [Futiania mangrovii]
MQLYLPIAELSVHILLLLSLGGGVGFLSGLFGVGGGFLMTPLLIFIGIPPAVAVATATTQTMGSSFSAMLGHMRRKNVDFRMGAVLLAGGIAGSAAGVELFRLLRDLGQVDLAISLAYVGFLGTIGAMMLVESLRALNRARRTEAARRKLHRHTWIHGLPLKMRFPRSKLYTSVFPPLVIGASVGLLAAIMGVGGGFIIVPAMIYILGMPTTAAIGTSLFQIVVLMGFTTMMHAYQNQTVDVVLALILLLGGVIGAQYGLRAGAKLKSEQLRVLLALLVLAVCLRLAYDLVATPDDLYSLARGLGT